MAGEDQDSKTEDPTGKRLSEAENKGNIALSREVAFVLSILCSLTMMLLILPVSARPMLVLMRNLVERPEQIPLSTPADLHRLVAELGFTIAAALGPPMLLFAASGIGAVVAQHGKIPWSTERLKLNWKALNPAAGLGRLFAAKALVEWAKGIVKVTLTGVATYLVLAPEYRLVERLVGTAPQLLLPLLLASMKKLFLISLACAVVIAAIDVIYQRWTHWKQLKMTKQEVKDEAKNADGDPTIKSKQRARRQQRARQRMMKAVPEASVVITNPTHYAVALKYERGMNAPKLVAKGMDFMAKRIRELATEADVPIIENPPLARAIHASVEIDQEIPPEHYKAVAEVISYVMKMRRRS